MKTSFKTAKIAASVALALGAATLSVPTQAVNLSADGRGQVGIIPFYSANGFDTYISIVNTSSSEAIVVKIRFRESDNSRDARDFNILLSPNDVWTGTVTVGADGQTPVIQTGDTSCTVGALKTSSEDPNVAEGQTGISFTADDYDGSTDLGRDTAADEGDSIVRTYDGHVEIIEMGASDPATNYQGDNTNFTIAGYGTHDSGYFDCAVVSKALLAPATAIDIGDTDDVSAQEEFDPPINSMKVAANIISVDSGFAAMIPVTSLANFYVPDGNQPQAPVDNLVVDPGSNQPNLNSAYPLSSTQLDDAGSALTSTFTRGVDAVSSLIMAVSVVNEYAIGGAAEVLNDWVVTFPTKNFYVDWDLIWQETYPDNCGFTVADESRPTDPEIAGCQFAGQLNDSEAIPPFTQWFQDVTLVTADVDTSGLTPPVQSPQDIYDAAPGDGDSCEAVLYDYYDREEAQVVGEEGFSPTPSGETNALCQEVQAIQIGDTSLLNATNNYGFIPADGFSNGWMRLTFTGLDNTLTETSGTTFDGLPILSFGLKNYNNGDTDEGRYLNYGVTQEAGYVRDITPSTGP